MTSFRQIEANRRNAMRSTGPSTEEGKRRTRGNAVRHGLCAETVVEFVEDIEDYGAFEAAVIADYDAQTAVERELVLRLASLLWRLRRATSIETDLLRIQAEILRDRRDQARSQRQSPVRFRVLEPAIPPKLRDDSIDDWDKQADEPCTRADRSHPGSTSQDIAPQGMVTRDVMTRDMAKRDPAHCFQRLANFDNALWRQAAQILFVLQSARHR
jgi:hypothetical protein